MLFHVSHFATRAQLVKGSSVCSPPHPQFVLGAFRGCRPYDDVKLLEWLQAAA